MKNISKKTISAAIISAILCGMTSSAYAAQSDEKDIIYAHASDGTVIEIEGKPFEEEDEVMLLDAGDNAEKDVIYAHSDDGTVIEIEGKPFEEDDGGIVVYSSSKPALVQSNYYDLFSSDYNADLQEVAPRWLYTNKYFLCSSSGRIYVDYNVQKDVGTSNDKMQIGIFDLSANTSYTDFKTGNINDFLTGRMYFSGLNSDHFYAVGFAAVPSTIGVNPIFHGSAVISHS